MCVYILTKWSYIAHLTPGLLCGICGFPRESITLCQGLRLKQRDAGASAWLVFRFDQILDDTGKSRFTLGYPMLDMALACNGVASKISFS